MTRQKLIGVEIVERVERYKVVVTRDMLIEMLQNRYRNGLGETVTDAMDMADVTQVSATDGDTIEVEWSADLAGEDL